MENDLSEKMRQWRDGLLSHAEITMHLLHALVEVNADQLGVETRTAERTFNSAK